MVSDDLHKGLIEKLKLKITAKSDVQYRSEKTWNLGMNGELVSFLRGLSRPLSREELTQEMVEEGLADDPEEASKYVAGILNASFFSVGNVHYGLEKITNAQGDERFRAVKYGSEFAGYY